MPTLARVLIAAAVVIGLVAGGTLFLQGSGQVTDGPSPSAPVASPASPTAEPSPTGVAESDLSLPFVSDRYGYTVSVNPGWTTIPATVSWTGPDNSTPVVDNFVIPGLALRFNGASQALAPGQTLSDWEATFQSQENAASACYGGSPSTWPTRQIGGRTWTWQQACSGATAITVDAGRVYVFTCSGCTEGFTDLNDLFDRLLSSVQLNPAGAAADPTAPPLGQQYAGDRNGFTLEVPTDWSVVQRATDAAPRDRLPVLTDPGLDVLGTDTLRLAVASFPLGKGETASEWSRAMCAFVRNTWMPPCDQAPGAWETVPLKSGDAWLAVDGETAATFPTSDSRMHMATAVADGRAYEIRLEGPAEKSLFLAILESMSLDPASAADATPRP